MTSIMVEPPGWGEERLAAREAARERHGQRLVAAFAVVAIGLPFAAGVVDGLTGRGGGMPGWATWAMLAGWAAIIPAALWWAWRTSDEMQRAAARTGLAVIGVAALLLVPMVELLADALAVPGIARLGWHLAVLAGLVAFWRQRGRA